MAAYDLLIFDLDGTLVASEQLATRLVGPVMAEHLGLHLSEDQITEHFRGVDLETQWAIMASMYGAPLPQTFFDAMEAEWIRGVQEELEPSHGVFDALEQLTEIPRCIASNSYAEGVELALRATKLDTFFVRYFCADDVENPKPAPDMFLLAAREMGVSPERCLVIEDTELGAGAALAAGMDVVGYVGNAPETTIALKKAGARVIHHFSELPGIVLA